MHGLLFSSGSAPENSRTSIFQTPAMQNLMQQVSANPDMFQNMMQSPYMQEMMQQMLQNPDLMASVSHFFYSWIIIQYFIEEWSFSWHLRLIELMMTNFNTQVVGPLLQKACFTFGCDSCLLHLIPHYCANLVIWLRNVLCLKIANVISRLILSGGCSIYCWVSASTLKNNLQFMKRKKKYLSENLHV